MRSPLPVLSGAMALAGDLIEKVHQAHDPLGKSGGIKNCEDVYCRRFVHLLMRAEEVAQ